MKPKVFLDSNVFVYAFEFWDSNSALIIDMLNDGEIEAFVSSRVLKEVTGYFRRFHGRKVYANAQMNTRDLKKHAGIDEGSEALLRHAMEELSLSARAYHKILKVARTIADLAGCEGIRQEHILEAIQYRSLDREFVV